MFPNINETHKSPNAHVRRLLANIHRANFSGTFSPPLCDHGACTIRISHRRRRRGATRAAINFPRKSGGKTATKIIALLFRPGENFGGGMGVHGTSAGNSASGSWGVHIHQQISPLCYTYKVPCKTSGNNLMADCSAISYVFALFRLCQGLCNGYLGSVGVLEKVVRLLLFF